MHYVGGYLGIWLLCKVSVDLNGPTPTWLHQVSLRLDHFKPHQKRADIADETPFKLLLCFCLLTDLIHGLFS